MQVFFGQTQKSFSQGCAITIGNFDGMHSGHLRILERLSVEAKARNLLRVVITFEPQPREYFAKQNKLLPPYRLSPLRDKLRLFKESNCLDAVVVYRFNKCFAMLTAEEFINQELINKLNVKYILIGDDFCFGKDRIGNIHLLQQQQEFITQQMNSIMVKNLRASSTTVRQALEAGDIPFANQLLGHDYTLSGRVIHGKKLGRKIGVPTANIYLAAHRYPLSGVFVVTVKGSFGCKLAVVSFGVNPTVSNNQKQKFEVHIIDFDQVIYGETLEIHFKHKIRDEVKFDSIEALQQQIFADIEIAKTWREV